MIIDNNLIAYEYYKNQFVPKEVYVSGEKEETSLINKYSGDNLASTRLIIENDIVNDDGYGLKKGFYNIKPDKYLDFLLIYETGNLKAKIPVIDVKFYESIDAKSSKPKKMSYNKYKKQQIKEYRKYLKGGNPAEINWSSAEIHYIDEQNAYILIYNSNNIEISGIIKF